MLWRSDLMVEAENTVEEIKSHFDDLETIQNLQISFLENPEILVDFGFNNDQFFQTRTEKLLSSLERLRSNLKTKIIAMDFASPIASEHKSFKIIYGINILTFFGMVIVQYTILNNYPQNVYSLLFAILSTCFYFFLSFQDAKYAETVRRYIAKPISKLNLDTQKYIFCFNNFLNNMFYGTLRNYFFSIILSGVFQTTYYLKIFKSIDLLFLAFTHTICGFLVYLPLSDLMERQKLVSRDHMAKIRTYLSIMWGIAFFLRLIGTTLNKNSESLGTLDVYVIVIGDLIGVGIPMLFGIFHVCQTLFLTSESKVKFINLLIKSENFITHYLSPLEIFVQKLIFLQNNFLNIFSRQDKNYLDNFEITTLEDTLTKERIQL